MKKKIILLCAALTALVLEILPFGAVCLFANPEGAPYRHTYSYFDLTPFGYANFAPLIVALLSCALLVLILVALIAKKPMRTPILVLSAAAAVLSFAPLLLGFDYFTPVAAMISLTLLLTTAVAFVKK